MGQSFISVDTDAVSQSGRATAGTSDDWASWAQQARTAFTDAAADVRDATVSDAISTYGSNLSGSLSSLAHDVDALGQNTTSASNTVDHSDADSAGTLGVQGTRTGAVGSHLSRPI
jgi:hypothetical protein